MKTRQKTRQGIILLSFFLFPATFYYLSPVLIIWASAQGIINGSFVVFVSMLASACFLGRGYCGWVCPAAGCQEAIFLARDTKVVKGDFIKWFLWVPWVISIVIVAIKAGGYHKIDFFFETTHGLSIGNVQNLISYFMVLLVLIVLPAFVSGKRAFCHYFCWMAPFMMIGRKIGNHWGCASLHLKSNPDLCKRCHLCSEKCPMSLPVEEMVNADSMENSECILCGSCVDGCKHGAIKFFWGKI